MSDAPTPEPTTAEAPRTARRSHRRRQRFLMRYLRPQMGAAVLIWRFEAYTATPIAIALIATIGRWEASLVMGVMMATYSAVFLYLLDGDPILQDLRAWVHQRRFGRIVTWLSERDDGVGRARRAAAVVPAVMLTGPFWRSIVFHLFGLRRLPAYALSVLGSFPHQLFWTGIVLGSLWEALFKPALGYVWDEMMVAAFQTVF